MDTARDPNAPEASTEDVAAAKAPWHPPTIEEVDYSETEAGGAGAVYDFVVYTGSV